MDPLIRKSETRCTCGEIRNIVRNRYKDHAFKKYIFAFQNISIRGVNLVQDPKPGSESSQVKGENQVIKLDPGIVIEDNVVTLENHKLVSTLTGKSIFLK